MASASSVVAEQTTSSSGEIWRAPDLYNPRYSQSLGRGLAILECFTPQHPVLGIVDIAEQLGMSRSTTHRYVSTLAALGYLEQGEARKYRLGLSVTDLGMSALNSMGLREHSQAYLTELARRAGYTVSLAVLDDNEIVLVDRVLSLRRGRREVDLGLGVGSRLPAHCTALGKVLLAYLPQSERWKVLRNADLKMGGPNTITQRSVLHDELARVPGEGFAVEDQELVSGRVAIAAPVLNEASEITAAIDMAAGAPGITIEELAGGLLAHLVSTADRISARLGYRREDES